MVATKRPQPKILLLQIGRKKCGHQYTGLQVTTGTYLAKEACPAGLGLCCFCLSDTNLLSLVFEKKYISFEELVIKKNQHKKCVKKVLKK